MCPSWFQLLDVLIHYGLGWRLCQTEFRRVCRWLSYMNKTMKTNIFNICKPVWRKGYLAAIVFCNNHLLSSHCIGLLSLWIAVDSWILEVWCFGGLSRHWDTWSFEGCSGAHVVLGLFTITSWVLKLLFSVLLQYYFTVGVRVTPTTQESQATIIR